MTFQWHINEICNWNCKHCYQRKPFNRSLPLAKLYKIFGNILKFTERLYGERIHGDIIFTGGEPLLRRDFFDFLKIIANYKNLFKFHLLTNGSLVTYGNAKLMRNIGIDTVQISIEGLEKINDKIRGKGSFKKIIKTCEVLLTFDHKVGLTMTVSKFNKDEMPKVLKLCDELGIKKLVLRRLVPIGNGRKLKNLLLEPYELREIYDFILERQKENKRRKKLLCIPYAGCDAGIYNQEKNSSFGKCALFEKGLLTILSNGDIIPCRRLPIYLGNIFKDQLSEIFYFSPRLLQIRNLNNRADICLSCQYFENCLSGAPCVTYAWFKKLSAPDPQCWRLFKKLPKVNIFKNISDKKEKSKRVNINFLFNYVKTNQK
jgi:radical SAM protein with 4Fe4S-binding SPASM domain